MTPEGKVKKKVRNVLDKYQGSIYVYMPVPGGFGSTTLDYLGCIRGRMFAIETKRPGGKPTERQNTIIERLYWAGAEVFVIDGDEGCLKLDQWLTMVVEQSEPMSHFGGWKP